MIKFLTGFVVGLLLTSFSIVSAQNSQFWDVDSGTWFTSAVNNLAEKNILQGKEDGSFAPTETVNRAQLAVVIDRLLQYLESGQVPIQATGDINSDYVDNFIIFGNEKYGIRTPIISPQGNAVQKGEYYELVERDGSYRLFYRYADEQEKMDRGIFPFPEMIIEVSTGDVPSKVDSLIKSAGLYGIDVVQKPVTIGLYEGTKLIYAAEPKSTLETYAFVIFDGNSTYIFRAYEPGFTFLFFDQMVRTFQVR